MFTARYGISRALIIGINRYQHVSPLVYAVSDATGIADLLISKFGFDEANVKILTDAEATRANILHEYLSLTEYGTDFDDRVVVFFAGHGHTTSSIRGEVGFLVPSDGNPNDLSTLIRWDELTRGSDMIRSKHVLFLMDACYGGLAVTRSLKPGAMRFLGDMLQRISRQVLTAGKADEVVSDSGGPLPNHSVFTGHLLEALSGKAVDNGGNLTANGVIAYVYQAVGADPSSQQTPHYGYIHGDGDLIFEPLQIDLTEIDAKRGDDRLVNVPAVLIQKDDPTMSILERLKELLSETKYRIQLHDFVAQSTRELLSKTGADYFPIQGSVSNESFIERLHSYEAAVQDLISQEMLLARWAGPEQASNVDLPLKRLVERIEPAGGSTYLINSRWYPVFLLLYAGGLGAIVGAAYENLFRLLHTPTANPFGTPHGDALVVSIIEPMNSIYDGFKLIPGHERHHVPRSEYIYKLLQPTADDILLIGGEYESVFDRFEMIYSLEYAHVVHPEPIGDSDEIRGPVGRFGWKGRFDKGPLTKLVEEATQAGNDWGPLRAGLFGGTLKRFLDLAASLQRLLGKLSWH
ncbi:MAG TPA: caspase family protein [Nitrospira sp.]|nr:caspase family protein [Nitrospira sp.]